MLKFPRKLRGSNHLDMQVNVSPQANGNSPVALDLVMVNDKDLAKKLAEMTAAQWFQQREQFQRDHPKKGDLVVRSWEWVPGQQIGELRVPYGATPRAALVFANYFNPGPHRLRLLMKNPVRISLGDADVALQAAKK